MTTSKRASAVPDLPTLAEAGVAGFDVTPWYGILAPSGTPEEIVSLLGSEIGKIMLLPDVRAFFMNQGLEVSSSRPEQLRQILQTETDAWAKVIKEANIKTE